MLAGLGFELAVFVDGVRQRNVLTVDAEGGHCRLFVLDDDGKLKSTCNNIPWAEVVVGKVALEITKRERPKAVGVKA
jgi:hypothetical protein